MKPPSQNGTPPLTRTSGGDAPSGAMSVTVMLRVSNRASPDPCVMWQRQTVRHVLAKGHVVLVVSRTLYDRFESLSLSRALYIDEPCVIMSNRVRQHVRGLGSGEASSNMLTHRSGDAAGLDAEHVRHAGAEAPLLRQDVVHVAGVAPARLQPQAVPRVVQHPPHS